MLIDIQLDCDNDSLLILAKAKGPACHLGTVSCFSNQIPVFGVLQQLETTIQQRKEQDDSNSYTVELLNAGINKIAQKLGEEAVETVVAALMEKNENLANEAADLLYHLLVILRARDMSIADVFAILAARAK